MNQKAKNDILLAVFGVIIGVALTVLAVMAKDTIVFHAKCDGVVVTKEFGTKRFCVDPSVLGK